MRRPDIYLCLIRHGEIQGNLEKRYIGLTDQALTENGAEEIRKKKERGFYPSADLLLSSPLTRCIETAAIICPGMEPVRVPEWTEMSFGEFEGKNYLELSGDPRYQAWIDSGGEGPFPGGEDRAGYCARVLRGFEKVKAIITEEVCRAAEQAGWPAEPTDSGEDHAAFHVLAAVHAGTIKALISSVTEEGYFDVKAKNGEGYRLILDGTTGALTDIRQFCET